MPARLQVVKKGCFRFFLGVSNRGQRKGDESFAAVVMCGKKKKKKAATRSSSPSF